MRALRIALAAAVAAWFAALAAVFLPELVRVAAIDLGWSLVCLLAGAAAFARARGPYRRSFLLLGAGTIAWGAGQLAWTWYDVVVGDVPYPSLADVGYTLALPLLAAGLLSWPRNHGGFRHGERVDGLLLAGAVALISVVFVIGPIVSAGLDGFSDWLLLAYPAGDVVMLGAATFGLAVQGFRDHGRMLVLALSLVALGFADAGFALAGDDYVTGGSLIDVGWTLGFAGVGAAALLPEGWGERLRLPRGAAPGAVLALLALAVAVQVVDQYREKSTDHLIGEVLAAGLLLVLGARHVRLSGRRLGEALRLSELTERLERESALRTATLEASRTGFCVFAADGALEYENPAWRRLSDGADLPRHGSGVVHTAHGRTLAFASTPLPGGELILNVDDVTEHERERATRDRFLAEIVRAQDLEARRIAELLHDDAVQRLTALGMRLELTAMRSGEPSLQELAAEAGAVTAAIRRLLVDLHPVVLESQGVAAAVDGAAESLRAAGLTVDVAPLDVRLVPEHEHLAFRLVQEALANAAAHADASRVEVSFAVEPDVFRCTVEDDGRGFEPTAVEHAVANGSMGLNLVRERTELAGGSFAIRRRDSGGTSFSFALPLRTRETEEEAA